MLIESYTLKNMSAFNIWFYDFCSLLIRHVDKTFNGIYLELPPNTGLTFMAFIILMAARLKDQVHEDL